MKKITSQFNAKVLVVDDYTINLELTKHMLEMMKCTVDVAESAGEAIDMVSSNDYDLILMDIQMPDMDGVKAMNKIREMNSTNKTTPIIALTANAIEGDREKYLESGMDDYLPKPITGEKLESVLKKHIDSQT